MDEAAPRQKVDACNIQKNQDIDTMRTKKGFTLKEICGNNILIAEGKENIDYSNIIKMNDSAALLWKAIEGKEFSVEDLANILSSHYVIGKDTPLPHERALADASSLTERWLEADIIED